MRLELVLMKKGTAEASLRSRTVSVYVHAAYSAASGPAECGTLFLLFFSWMMPLLGA